MSEASKAVAANLSGPTLQNFVHAVRAIVDELGKEPVGGVDAPPPVDYAHATIEVGSPPGGWLSVAEFKDASQRMTEAIASEKWVDGFIAAVQLVILIGGVA